MERKRFGEKKDLSKILELVVVGMVVRSKEDCFLVCLDGKFRGKMLGMLRELLFYIRNFYL